MDELMTVSQVAEEKGLVTSAVRLAIYTGRLKARKVGQSYIVCRRDAAEWKPAPRGPKARAREEPSENG
jgi:ribosomal protein S24E